jgi:alkylation response protein AidB-like acyl-CoA dehydrogenase
MFEWSEEQLAIRDAVRRFVEEEIKPNVEELEHGDTPPYEVIRKLYKTFGLDSWPGTGSSASSNASSPTRPSPGRQEGGGNAAMT